MSAGYLYLVTHTEHPGLIRVMNARHMPALEHAADGSAVRYLVRCNDVETAELHLHSALRWNLLDIDNHLYRSDLLQAIAAIAADDPRHRQIWLDPSLEPNELKRIETLTRLRRARRRRIDLMWQAIGGVGIALVLLNALVLF